MLGITYHCDIARGEYVGVVKGLEPFLALTWGLFCLEKKIKIKKYCSSCYWGQSCLSWKGARSWSGQEWVSWGSPSLYQEDCKMKQALCCTPKLWESNQRALERAAEVAKIGVSDETCCQWNNHEESWGRFYKCLALGAGALPVLCIDGNVAHQ